MKEEPIDKPDNKEPKTFLGMDGEEWAILGMLAFISFMLCVASNP